jgi:hypothetical protein
MRGSKNRVVLHVEVMETKLVLSALAPVAAVKAAAAPAVPIEQVAARPMASGNNVVFINNSTNFTIDLSAELGADRKAKMIDSGVTGDFRFIPNARGFIFVTKIESRGIGPGPLPQRARLTPNRFNAFYLDARYTVSVSRANQFSVSPSST